MGCEGYDAVARVYDRLNAEIDYKEWADFFEECFDRYLSERPTLVLDLACGTGRMTRELSSRGYDMIGVDGSPSMLSEAYSENRENILYLLQDMRSFELYGTVGATVCCLDSPNYLLDARDLKKTFLTVHNYLDPDGLFIFDMNTPYKFKNVYGDNAYILEDDDGKGHSAFCGWQNEYDEESRICDFYLTIFEENEDSSYERSDEHQRERCYEYSEIETLLCECGFEFLGCYSDTNFSPCENDTERWYIVARAKKQEI